MLQVRGATTARVNSREWGKQRPIEVLLLAELGAESLREAQRKKNPVPSRYSDLHHTYQLDLIYRYTFNSEWTKSSCHMIPLKLKAAIIVSSAAAV